MLFSYRFQVMIISFSIFPLIFMLFLCRFHVIFMLFSFRLCDRSNPCFWLTMGSTHCRLDENVMSFYVGFMSFLSNRSQIGVLLCRFLNYQIDVIFMSFSWRFDVVSSLRSFSHTSIFESFSKFLFLYSKMEM